jgi:kumamolisin
MTTATPLPVAIGCSWGWTPVDPSTLDPYFEKMAAQGQNFFAASGDSSTWSKSNYAWPADDANVVSVGGTDLVTQSAAGAWKSETAWADSGGGISPDNIAIPSWQQLSGVINSSNKGSTVYRNGPDVAANANFTFYVCADQTTCTANRYGGTSFAAPMWAGYIALANQQVSPSGKPSIGFLNPTVYNQNVGSGYATNFHDITSGTSGSYSAVTGYDLVTGWGSPNAGLIAALTGGGGGGTTGTFTLSSSNVSIQAGSQGSSTISDTISNGPLPSTVALSETGIPSGWTYTFNPTSLSSSSNAYSSLTITVPSGATTNSYPITVTGVTTGTGGQTETTNFTLNVTSAPAGDFSIGAGPSLSVAQNSTNSETVTITPSGGFNSNVSLSVSFSARGSSATLSSSTVAGGSGSVTLSVKATKKAATGTYPLVITATGGGQTHTATVSVQVVTAASKH